MRWPLFNKYFPVPKYLELSSVGLDISDESVKFIELANGPTLRSYGDVDLPAGTVVSGKIVNREVLVMALAKIKQDLGFGYVHACLPEEEAFVMRMNLPWVPGSQVRESIELSLEEYIPLPADQVEFDFDIYSYPADESGNYVLSVSAVPKALVADYLSVLTEAGLPPISLEVEVQSGARSLVMPGDDGTYMIVDIGKTRTGFSIVSRGVVMFTSTIKSIGGENLTGAVARALKLDAGEAEKIKIKQGLLRSESNAGVFEALVPIISALKDETRRHYNYWEELKQNGEVSDSINKVIFCGGQSSLPGLVEYISADLPVAVEVGNPWASFMDLNRKLPPVDFNTSLRYGSAIGLALRGLSYF